MEPRKHAICEALSRWINQRPGFELGNYDRAGYLADSRKVQQQRRDALRLLMEVTRWDTLRWEDIVKAAESAFSGRLTIHAVPNRRDDASGPFHTLRIDYTTGQYMPTEYRAAACAVLASALWEWTRKHAMPGEGSPNYRVMQYGSATDRPMSTEIQYKTCGRWMSAGDWLRAHFRREFGRGIAQRWLS